MTLALYNDNDPFAAAWLRELIRHGHIPQGAVIDKSITDLQPEDVAGHGQRHFFAGIGGWAHALDLAGVRRDADIWTGSCPCQPLSDAGKGRGFSDPRHLWPAWFSLIRECRPSVIFGEQVASKLGLEWLDLVFADLERCGYAVGAADLCAAGVGAPHQRQRLFFVAYAVGLGREQVESLLLPEREPGGDLLEADRGGKAGAVADAAGVRRGDEQGSPRARRQQPEPAGSGEAHGVADAPSQQRQRRGRARGGVTQPTDRKHDGRVADPGSEGLEVQRLEHARGERSAPERGGEASILEHPSRTGSGRHSRTVPGAQAQAAAQWQGTRRLVDVPVATGATRGFWADAEWILCRDPAGGPPVARPVEPGSFPLVAGVPGRVGLLRGYGNSIVPQVGAAFIRAFFETWRQR